MNFDELLERYEQIKSDIRSLMVRQQELEQLGKYPKGYSDGTPQSNIPTSMVENFVIKMDELKSKKSDLELVLFGLQEEISKYLNAIDTIDFTEKSKVKEVCEYRLLLSYSWKKIAYIIDKSYSRTREYYNIGLDLMRRITIN